MSTSLAAAAVNSGVSMIDRSCSDLINRRVSEPASDDAAVWFDVRVPLLDTTAVVSVQDDDPDLIRRQRMRRAMVRTPVRINRAVAAPVMMATRGLIWPLEDGSGRGGSSSTARTCKQKKKKKKKKNS